MATDWEVVDMMERYGGSFVCALARLCYRADKVNLAKIKATWPEYWAKYAQMAERVKERDASAR